MFDFFCRASQLTYLSLDLGLDWADMDRILCYLGQDYFRMKADKHFKAEYESPSETVSSLYMRPWL
jgi:hypothetical protein